MNEFFGANLKLSYQTRFSLCSDTIPSPYHLDHLNYWLWRHQVHNVSIQLFRAIQKHYLCGRFFVKNFPIHILHISTVKRNNDLAFN